MVEEWNRTVYGSILWEVWLALCLEKVVLYLSLTIVLERYCVVLKGSGKTMMLMSWIAVAVRVSHDFNDGFQELTEKFGALSTLFCIRATS